MKSRRTLIALPAALTVLLAGAVLLVSTPADAAPGRAAQRVPALAPTPQPVIQPPFVDDGRRHVVENVSTHGYLIHEFLSSPACNDVTPCHVFAWTATVEPPANEWYFEDAQTRRGEVWFRMRNAKSNKCAVPGGFAFNLPSVEVRTCGSSNEFLWRAEPDRSGDWRTVKFVSYTTSNAIRPYGTSPNEYTVLTDDGYSPNYYWSVAR